MLQQMTILLPKLMVKEKKHKVMHMLHASSKSDIPMILFLKFISSVVPTIEYDFTMPAGM